MRYSKKRRLYESLPDALKTPVRWVPFGILAGRAYRQVLKHGRALDRASREEVLAYQESRLGAVLRFATEEIPAYRSLAPLVSRLRPFEALKGFPLVSKETLQQRMPEFLARDFERIPHYECSTGGTSGNQLRFFVDDASQAVEMAFMHRQWSRVGYHPGCRKATFRGVDFPNLPSHVYWQANPVYNELQFSPYHLNEYTIPLYVARLKKYDPAYLHGYPSAISLLASFVALEPRLWAGIRVRAVLLGSEALEAGQRELIEQALGGRVFSWYGHSERVVLGGECEDSRAYHHFPDYGVMEIVREDGEVVTQPGESGELVGTGLFNRSLPLIRYRTGDRARLLDWRCGCGLAFDRFDNVEGRWLQEYVVGKHGSRISVAALNTHGPFFARVVRYQYYQRVRGAMEIRVMVTSDFGDDDLGAMKAAYLRKVGDELAIQVRVVDEIPLTGSGKLRRLVQELPMNA